MKKLYAVGILTISTHFLLTNQTLPSATAPVTTFAFVKRETTGVSRHRVSTRLAERELESRAELERAALVKIEALIYTMSCIVQPDETTPPRPLTHRQRTQLSAFNIWQEGIFQKLRIWSNLPNKDNEVILLEAIHNLEIPRLEERPQLGLNELYQHVQDWRRQQLPRILESLITTGPARLPTRKPTSTNPCDCITDLAMACAHLCRLT